ncbi:reverse transcriptase domain-containing protein [Marichromatium gracile]|nr:reverse transcriptase domain-containing protein [Marichromatium gracile]
MSVVERRYDRLIPCLEYLTDEVVLAQAWKKAERYARWYNWYADTLALDLAVLTIESDLADWAAQVRQPKFQPEPMQLVPAPKNCPWEFPHSKSESPTNRNWIPKKTPQLRPLAHLTVRDQTLAMGLVLCFADAVETLQGPTDQPDVDTARKRGVFSYGNRLWCDWQNYENQPAHARFRWGSAATYSAYFEDYRRFLARPAELARVAASRCRAEQTIYVVELDLKRFFDCISRERLVTRLAAIWRLYARHFVPRNRSKLESEFIDSAHRIMSWKWSDEAEAQRGLFSDSSSKDKSGQRLPAGLPQGLVASGFLSNAYMLRFDRWIGRQLGSKDDEDDVLLYDYCRYVDDMRLVVETDRSKNPEEIGNKVADKLQGLLNRYCKGLDEEFQLFLNPAKTKVVPWADYAIQSSASVQMAWLQGLISATPDQDSLRQATTGLDGLLWLSEAIESADKVQRNPLALSRIALPKLDVRDDTLKRFAAYRLLKSFRLRQSMTSEGRRDNPDSVATLDGASRSTLEHEMEATARKLVASWSRNPALVPVLRCGLKLFPSPELLKPILEALMLKRLPEPNHFAQEQAVADYVIAELLRAAAVDIGYQDAELIPRRADLESFREQLATIARTVLEESPAAPWFLRQQAALYLGSLLQPEADLVADMSLKNYKLLHDALLFRQPDKNDAVRAIITGLIGQQLGANQTRFATWVDAILDKHQGKAKWDLVTALGHMRPDLLQAAWKAHGDKRRGWTHGLNRDHNYLHPSHYVAGKWGDWHTLGSEPLPLIKVVLRRDNPFRQENAALGLLAALLKAMSRPEYQEARVSWGLLNLKVACNRWKDPQHPDASFEITVIENGPTDPRNQPPNWCRKDMTWAYAVGRVLRACIVGDPDFTARGFLVREDHVRYRGLSSSWPKRRLGLLNTPEGLLGEPAPLSPWLIDLIMYLLQWPGVHPSNGVIEGLDRVETPEQLVQIVTKRQKQQRQIYGVQSGLPVYVRPASRGPRENERALRVAMVQTLMPRMTDFDVKNPLYWSTDYRARHRAHLASVCRLVAQHLAAERSASSRNTDKGKPAGIDLIVLPELSVHPDDLWLLRSLSDTTKSNLFVGLTFQEGSDGQPVNHALWLLRHEHNGSREIVRVHQGKQHMTKSEQSMGVQSNRPYQVLIELNGPAGARYRLAGAICYDATDLSLAADLRDQSDCLVIAALNKDVPTFDTMVQALNYHMFQPVVMTNCGEFGGSTAQVPYKERHEKVIAHVHGSGQIAVNIFELDLTEFKSKQLQEPARVLKTWPAGYQGRPK